MFFRTEMDYLVMGDYLFDKKEQDEWYTGHPKEKYGLD